MNALDTRELAYFVAVAQERHFGRAATSLGIAQPSLSRAVRQIERRLGVALLERTTRSVRLTAAGEVLLVEGRKAIAATEAAALRAQQAGNAARRLRVVTKPEGDAGLLRRIVPRYRRDPAAIEVEVLVCENGEQVDMLRSGRADVGFLHPPHDDLEGFDTALLLTQSQVAVLPTDHRLASRSSIELADLDDEALPVWPGRRARDADAPTVRDAGHLTTLAALGQLVAVVPRSVQRLVRSDIVYVPVTDAPESHVVLAWPADARSDACAAFAAAGVTVAHADHIALDATGTRDPTP